jgi:alkylation response protein AidB-like acyl-CoA dehydrogenase
MRAAHMKDDGKKVTMKSAMAKLYASEAPSRICDEGSQIHCGYGFIKDYPAEKFIAMYGSAPSVRGPADGDCAGVARE